RWRHTARTRRLPCRSCQGTCRAPHISGHREGHEPLVCAALLCRHPRESSRGLTATGDQRPWPEAAASRSDPAAVSHELDATRAEAPTADDAAPLPRRGLLDRDWQKALVVLLTLLAGVALFWVVWQVVSPILHTLVLFALAAVLAFALSGPVDMLNRRV